MKTLLAVLLASCLSPSAVRAGADEAVASVNGAPIALSAFQKSYNAASMRLRANRSKPQGPAALKGLADTTLEGLIDQELLNQEGAKLKISVTEGDLDWAMKEVGKRKYGPEQAGGPVSEQEAEARFYKDLDAEGITYGEYRQRLAREVMVRKVLEREVESKLSPPGDAEVRAWFDKLVAAGRAGSKTPPPGLNAAEGSAFLEFSAQIKDLTSEQVRFSRLLVKFPPGAKEEDKKKTLEAVKAIKKRIEKGESFAKVARAESQDPDSAARGGDMGFITRGHSLPEVEAAVFKAAVGAVTPPVKTDLGYNLLFITGKRAPEPPSLNRFKDETKQFLAVFNAARATEKYIGSLKAKAVIKKYPALLAGAVPGGPTAPKQAPSKPK